MVDDLLKQLKLNIAAIAQKFDILHQKLHINLKAPFLKLNLEDKIKNLLKFKNKQFINSLIILT